MAITHVAHVELGVEDVESVARFHERVLGMRRIATRDGVAYLGCGAHDSVDVILRPGAGFRGTALEVDSESSLDAYVTRLTGAGVDVRPEAHPEPGQRRVVRFSAPSGHAIKLVVATEPVPYNHPASTARSPRGGVGLLDLDHLTWRTPDVKPLVDFLVEHLDFTLSDSFQPAPDDWQGAWLRCGDLHHDIAVIGAPDTSYGLDHVAWTLTSFDDIKRAADELATAGVPLEVFVGRHAVSATVSAYFWCPGEHRYELCAEMPRMLASSQPRVWTDFAAAFSAWGVSPPESFARGS